MTHKFGKSHIKLDNIAEKVFLMAEMRITMRKATPHDDEMKIRKAFVVTELTRKNPIRQT